MSIIVSENPVFDPQKLKKRKYEMKKGFILTFDVKRKAGRHRRLYVKRDKKNIGVNKVKRIILTLLVCCIMVGRVYSGNTVAPMPAPDKEHCKEVKVLPFVNRYTLKPIYNYILTPIGHYFKWQFKVD